MMLEMTARWTTGRILPEWHAVLSCVRFSAQAGMSFGRWRQQARFCLLRLRCWHKAKSVTEVAIAVGYDSVSAFIEMFRTMLGNHTTKILSRQAFRSHSVEPWAQRRAFLDAVRDTARHEANVSCNRVLGVRQGAEHAVNSGQAVRGDDASTLLPNSSKHAAHRWMETADYVIGMQIRMCRNVLIEAIPHKQ